MSRAELIRTIKQHQLHYRSQKWYECLFLAEQGIYSDDFCKIFIEETQKEIEGIVASGNYLYKPPEDGDLQEPDIEIGTLIESDLRFGIKFVDRPRNCLILGGAGGGKTKTLKQICVNVSRANQKQPDNPTLLIILDIKPAFLNFAKLLGPTVLLSAINNAKWGLNAPAGVSAYVWISQVTLSIAGRLNLISARVGLSAIITKLLLILNPGLKEDDLKNPTVSKHLIWPPLKTVLEVARHPKLGDYFFSKANYMQSLIGALEGLLIDSFDVFECNNGLDINDVIAQKKHIIINVSTLPSYVTHIITDILINQVLIQRMATNYSTSHTDIIFALDESDLLLASDVSNFPDLSPLDKLFRLGRSMGLMSCLCVSGM